MTSIARDEKEQGIHDTVMRLPFAAWQPTCLERNRTSSTSTACNTGIFLSSAPTLFSCPRTSTRNDAQIGIEATALRPLEVRGWVSRNPSQVSVLLPVLQKGRTRSKNAHIVKFYQCDFTTNYLKFMSQMSKNVINKESVAQTVANLGFVQSRAALKTLETRVP